MIEIFAQTDHWQIRCHYLWEISLRYHKVQISRFPDTELQIWSLWQFLFGMTIKAERLVQ